MQKSEGIIRVGVQYLHCSVPTTYVVVPTVHMLVATQVGSAEMLQKASEMNQYRNGGSL